MPVNLKPPRKRKFYPEDLVYDTNTPDNPALVLKTWQDDEISDSVILSQLFPGSEGLRDGEVLIHDVASGPTIAPEEDLRLLDRTFQLGDCCKRAADEISSGVIIDIQAKGLLEHAISKEPVPGWKTMQDVEVGNKAQIGDYVLHGDWIGEVVEVFDETLVETGSGYLLTIPELRSPFSVGDTGYDILPKESMIATAADKPDMVLSIQHTVYAISWLALNQTLSPEESQGRVRPKRFWHGEDLSTLARFNPPCVSLTAGVIVWLKDADHLPKTTHIDKTNPSNVATISTYSVKQTQTTATVLWQDGTQETLPSVDLVPHLTVDEHDSWPGDHVVWKGEDKERAAVIQKVNAADRTAEVLFTDTKTTELVSLLELELHSPIVTDPNGVPDELGVRQGDVVFVHSPGQTNGLEPPRVPRIGVIEPWAQEPPKFDDETEPTGWRKEMADLGSSLLTFRVAGIFSDGKIKDSREFQGSFNWIGHVTCLNLDGTVEVTHPDNSKATYRLEQLTKLYDTMEQLDDFDADNPNLDAMEEDDFNEWINEDATDNLPDVDMEDEGALQDSTLREEPLQSVQSHALGHDESNWKRFDVLPSAPADHAFYSAAPASPSKAFLSRIQREYRILTSSLPDTILVRAYEDRIDLLRSLIVGPDNTPYEDAPFVIDWKLESDFPNSPPRAHFHSWTNGNGRVNPNLYEEGKVCLSILGTWQGDRNESWSAARSSLLQAFVSIQGLVLVKEPWYCEPGYEKMRGTEDALINSRLYSEKAFVLSREFVRRALEVPIGGLESEIEWMYIGCRRLEKVISEARALVKESKAKKDSSSRDADAAVPLLTTGGVILLERTLTRLQRVSDSRTT